MPLGDSVKICLLVFRVECSTTNQNWACLQILGDRILGDRILGVRILGAQILGSSQGAEPRCGGSQRSGSATTAVEKQPRERVQVHCPSRHTPTTQNVGMRGDWQNYYSYQQE
jgi:hypothetical protein